MRTLKKVVAVMVVICFGFYPLPTVANSEASPAPVCNIHVLTPELGVPQNPPFDPARLNRQIVEAAVSSLVTVRMSMSPVYRDADLAVSRVQALFNHFEEIGANDFMDAQIASSRQRVLDYTFSEADVPRLLGILNSYGPSEF